MRQQRFTTYLSRFGLRLPALATLAVAAAVLVGCATLTGAAGPTPTAAPMAVATPTATGNSTLPVVVPGPGSRPTPIDAPAGLAGLPSIADLVEKVEPAVVNILVRATQQSFFGVQQGTSSGSGVIFRPDGYILTNNHVIDGADSIKVTLNDTRQYDASVVGAYPESDLAVIKIGEKDLPTLPFGEAYRLRVGDWVVAIGNAAGLEGKPSVTLGIVSALNRSLDEGDTTLSDLIQTDAVINPGNSGGPLLNLNGEVVGINSVILGGQFNGIGFAVSADTASLVADQLVRSGKVTWPRMGVFIQDLDQLTIAQLNLSARQGVLVTRTEESSPAEKAGIRPNDVIVALNGTPTPDLKTLLHLLRSQYKAGQKVTVTVMRGKDKLDFTLTLSQSQS